MTDRSGVPLNRRTLLGAAAVLGVGLAGIGGFLVSEDIVGPWRLTAWRMVDRLEAAAGGHFPGYRRNHAKGVAVSGYFDSNGSGAELSKASAFRPGRYRLAGRFSLGGGNPHMPDDPTAPRGLGLQLFLPGGEQWRMAMVNVPVFLDATPEDFYTRTTAFAPDPATGKPDPEKMKQHLATHPETAAALDIIGRTPPAPGFVGSTFYGLNAFECIAHDGRRVPVRWHLEPETAPSAENNGGAGLFAPLIRRIAAGPLRWTLVLVVGVPGVDPTHDATKPWPDDRRRIAVGTVVVDRVHTEAVGNVEAVAFDPLVLPDGLAPSDDPLLAARSAAYAESFRRRSAEPTAPGAVVAEEA
ncbi:catalase family peroxidase [Nocardia terpenica]|uniref:Catalase-related peroxidase n=1 Tax=Nocardia terpenica TaxID=455432 RepID=A0A164KUW5_9NOCA|nr:catalase family peroxidase [Nocardia terpenica]KZM71732.1 catalase [Nocardia terpenica]NQE90979.1 catalase family peroxidase [Nocardia terpenica]